MNPFTAAVWQTTSLPYDKEANLARALGAMEAARTLRAAGAAQVVAAVLARTPGKQDIAP